ncbi:unnamed protein product, partial [Onchocerca flexuosa]|uniref:Secreted protein n=1 Tax=Onchocerca flexuosa TaxID=387005 RepID=A0A183HFH8_9BILA
MLHFQMVNTRLLTLLLWFNYCSILDSGSVDSDSVVSIICDYRKEIVDNTHVSHRVRNAIRRLPYHSRRNSIDNERKWQQVIIVGNGELIVDQVAEWLRRWTANPLGFPRVSS